MRSLLIAVVFVMVFSLSHCIDETYDDNTAVVTETVETHKCKTNEVWMECGTCENKCGEPRV
ncbi:Trypsin Inhibitor like cysteine rich domain protein, partial [Trichostrongylus colubriformis]